MEICHQHPLPPKKGGPELPLNGPQCSSCTTTTRATPPNPWTLKPERLVPRGSWGGRLVVGLPTTKHLSYVPEASASSESGGSFLSPQGEVQGPRWGKGPGKTGSASRVALLPTEPARCQSFSIPPSPSAPAHQRGLLPIPRNTSQAYFPPHHCPAQVKPASSLAGPIQPPWVSPPNAPFPFQYIPDAQLRILSKQKSDHGSSA